MRFILARIQLWNTRAFQLWYSSSARGTHCQYWVTNSSELPRRSLQWNIALLQIHEAPNSDLRQHPFHCHWRRQFNILVPVVITLFPHSKPWILSHDFQIGFFSQNFPKKYSSRNSVTSMSLPILVQMIKFSCERKRITHVNNHKHEWHLNKRNIALASNSYRWSICLRRRYKTAKSLTFD